jgi:hypothetical protein
VPIIRSSSSSRKPYRKHPVPGSGDAPIDRFPMVPWI